MAWKGMTGRPACGIVFLLTVFMLGGCASGSGGGDFCRLYEPVYWSVQDSTQTIAALTRNNAVWGELCAE